METKEGSILIVDDNEDILFTLQLFLKQFYSEVVTESDPHNIPLLLKQKDFDLIMLDMNFTQDVISGQEGFYWLQQILDIDPHAVVIFITAYGDVERAVKAIKLGAMDFVLKPWKNEKLLATVHAGLHLRKTKLEAANLRTQQKEISANLDQPFHDFIGQSEPMQQVFQTIHKVAQTDASVLILGENGTGKELVARALHRHSKRQDEVFISVDLGSISETLFESELFGHRKGAFTDAKESRAGRFKIASGGSIFLDEIGNLSLPLQAKLLTVLEKREVIPVGTNKPVPIDVRLICATNLPIYQMVDEHKFRQDLLYRINTVEIHLPPLRERIEDIELLANHFLKMFSAKYKKQIKGFHREAMIKLEAYSWPGNVRELRHAIERAVILTDQKILQTSDFWLTKSQRKEKKVELETFNIDEVEKSIIKKVLNKYKGNITKAAKELGLTRASLYRRLEKYDI